MTGKKMLVVDDNPLDIRALVRAAHRLGLEHVFETASSGDEAVGLLMSGIDDSDLPDLLLFDLHLPGTDGIDLLVHRTSVPELKRIPAVVMTSSSDETDVRSAYEAGANAFITKPADLDGWIEVIGQIDDFWFHTATLPSR
ncbi:MAG: response regulator [Actinomycetia bacterium]|nr:response regulator [Actinomycetes bacterium]MCP4960751.1 response regulator [Actinomycetes bacterium]